MQELVTICTFVCACDKVPFKRKEKTDLKQSCVDVLTEAYLDINNESPIVPEAPYYVGEDGTVIPC
jgi:hypothetical protein